MKVTIEIENTSEIDILMNFFKSLGNSISFKIEEGNDFLEKGDKSVDITGLFGIWKENPVDINTLRKVAWERKSDSL